MEMIDVSSQEEFDEFHRDNDLPAIEYPNGDKEWHRHGKRHRNNDLPAVECANGDKEWWYHGNLHRLDGPAAISADGNKDWWYEDKFINVKSQEEFERYLQSLI